jgi:tetratricopeptide (TPR) repeat protein
LLAQRRFAAVDRQLSEWQAGYERGAISDEDLRAAFRVFYDTNPALGSLYDAWVSEFPRSYSAHLVRGLYYTKIGENLPANQNIANLPQPQRDAIEAAYQRGLPDLRLSLALTHRPILTYVYLVWTSRAHSDVAESRRLLDASLRIDRDNYIVRAVYMTAIETRWGGSQAMLKAFLEDCRHTKLSDRQLDLIESVLFDDQAWIHHFVDHDYAAAEVAYRRSAALGGDASLHNLSDVLFKQAKYADAIVPLTELLEIDPNDLDVLSNRGFAYMQSGKPQEAITDWTTAAQHGSAYAQNELGRLYMMGVPGVLTPNPKTGIELFRLSAAQGSAAGAQNLHKALQLHPPAASDGPTT